MFNIFSNKFIISEKEKLFLLNWVFKNEHKFILNQFGPHRKFYSFDNDSEVPSLFYEVRNRIIKKQNIKKWYPEPIFGNYIGWISEGGFIHKHKDPNTYHGYHTRYNVFLSIPLKGGNPIYSDKIIPVKEREYICCKSGTEFHQSNPVIGNKPRVVISYGFILPSL